MKILSKILFAIMGTLALISITWIIFFEGYFHNSVKTEIQDKLKITSAVKTQAVKSFFENEKNRIFAVSASFPYEKIFQILKKTPEERTKEEEKIILLFQTDLENYTKMSTSIHHFLLVDAAGKIVVTSNDEKEHHHQARMMNDEFSGNLFEKFSQNAGWSDLLAHSNASEEKKFTILFGLPFLKNGDLQGILVAEFKLDFLFSLLDIHDGLGETGETYLVGKDGLMRSFSRIVGENVVLSQKVVTKNTEHCFAEKQFDIQKSENIFPNYKGISVFGIHSFIPEMNWCLLTEMEEKEAFSASDRLLFLMAEGIFIIAIIFFLLSFFLARKILQPLAVLSKNVQEFGEGIFSSRVLVHTTDEVGTLAKVFNAMADSLQETTEKIEKKVEEQTEIIQAQKKVAEKLALERKKFYLAVKNSSEHIVIVDTDFQIVYANDSVLNFTGYNPKNILGENLRMLWQRNLTAEEFLGIWETAKKEKFSHTYEIVNVRQDGSSYIVNTHITPIFQECSDFEKSCSVKNEKEIAFFVMIEEDITKRKEVEKMKNEFIDIASHELRTPMTLIRGYASLILEDFSTEIPSIAKTQLEHILKNTERLIAMVNDMLDISKIESGKMLSLEEKGDFDLRECFHFFQEFFLPALEKKEVELLLEIPESEVVLAHYSKDGLKRILTNLVGNALKFVPEKTGKIVISVESENETFWKIGIQDNGPGISKENQKKIFKKFGMVENSKNHTTTGGTGLGLVISESIIQKSGGKIWLESEEGKGTTFFFTLPKGEKGGFVERCEV